MVPSTGGTVYNDDDGDGNPDIEINFPARALGSGSTPVTVSIKANPDVISTQSAAPLAYAMQDITITKSDGSTITSLNSKATMTIYYQDEDLPEGFDESNLRLVRWNSSTKDWTPIAATVDADNNKITAKVDQFSPNGPGQGGAPSTPEGLSASASANTISLTWNSVANATSYYVYRSSTAGGTYTKIGTTSSASYDDTGLSYSTTYYYKVSAVNANGESTKSSAVSATTESAPGGVVPIQFLQPQPEAVPEEIVEEVPEEKVEEITIPTLEKPVSEMTIEELEAKIAEFLAAIEQLKTLLAEIKGTPTIEGIPAGFKFETNLRVGEVSDEIKYLQIFLNSDPDTQLATEGPGSPGNETTYFGPLTKAAVVKFQEKYADDVLAPWGITEGTGFVGSTTRAKLNSLLGR